MNSSKDPLESRASRLNARIRWALLFSLFCILPLSGCVVGYGACLALQPFKNTLSGRIHFRDFPEADGVDNVPVLELDDTAYLYAPAQSLHCLSANDVQLVGVSEFPQNIGENAHVRVKGALFEAVSPREHTRFLMNVAGVELIGRAQ